MSDEDIAFWCSRDAVWDAMIGVTGELDGKEVHFNVERMEPDGDCGYHGLEVTREEAVVKLSECKDDPEMRALVGMEIRSMLVDDA